MTILQLAGWIFVVGMLIAAVAAVAHYDGWRRGLTQGRVNARTEREADEHEGGIPQ